MKVEKIGSGGKAASSCYQAARRRAEGVEPATSSADRVVRVQDFPYLDPSAGFGSQPRGPVTAGQPARVCWKIKNAPKGALVDLFEDQNGNLGTGRRSPTGVRPRAASTSRPPASSRAGTGSTAWSASATAAQPALLADPDHDRRPGRAPAPANVSVTATPTVRGVSWGAVDGAAGYVVRPTPPTSTRRADRAGRRRDRDSQRVAVPARGEGLDDHRPGHPSRRLAWQPVRAGSRHADRRRRARRQAGASPVSASRGRSSSRRCRAWPCGSSTGRPG